MASNPAVSIKRFRGLRTASDHHHINDDELSKSVNLDYSRDGTLQNRPGLSLWYVGELVTWAAGDDGCSTYYRGTLWFQFASGDPLGISFFGGHSPSEFTPDWVFHGAAVRDERYIRNTVLEDAGQWVITGPVDAEYCARVPGVQFIDPNDPALYPHLWCLDGAVFDIDGAVDLWPNFEGEPDPVTGENISRYGVVTLHQERIFVTWRHNYNERVWFCEPADPTVWSGDNAGFLDIEPYWEGYIVQMLSYQDNLYVFKTTGVWVIYTNGAPSNWIVKKISNFGCWGQTALVYEGSIYWTGPDGAFCLNGSSLTRISDPIQDIFDQDKLSGGGGLLTIDIMMPRAAAHNGRYVVLLIDGDGVDGYDGIYNRRLLCYNIQAQAWSEWTLYGPDMNQVLDLFAIDHPAGDRGGIYLTIRNEVDNFPVVYKFNDEEFVDDQVGHLAQISSLTTTVITSNVTLAAGTDYSGWLILMCSGNRKGDYFQVASNTTGASAQFTLTNTLTNYQQLGSHGLQANDYFVLVKRNAFPVELESKVWDFDNPGAFKRVKKAVMDLDGHATLGISVEHDGAHHKVQRSAKPSDDSNVIGIGGLRGQNFQFSIHAESQVNKRLMLHELSLYMSEAGDTADDVGRDK